MESFNPHRDKIAVVLKEFTLKRKSDGLLDRFSEPYVVSMAIDENGAKSPAIDFNILPFPNVKKGDTVSFDGQGHLIYGPNNPGQFLAYSLLFMESDRDIRNFGQMVEDILTSEAINSSAKVLLAATPTYSTALNVLQKIAELTAIQLQKNKDDELFRRNGTLLRDVIPSYDILRTYKSENRFIQMQTSIIPLKESNQIGVQTKRIYL